MDNGYLILKSVHMLGLILFIGNIIVTGWWKAMADRTGNPQIIAFAQGQVTVTDYIFTAGGAILTAIGGIGAASYAGMDFLNIKWLSWGYWLFMASGILWVFILIPVQIKQAKLAREFQQTEVIPSHYWTLNRIWYVVGILATVLPMINIYWMVYKPV